MDKTRKQFIIVFRAKGSKQRHSTWDDTPRRYWDALDELREVTRKHGWNREFILAERKG